jgi:gamma-glutamylcyclotransferase
MLYFAYGSNMSTARLLARTPSARVVKTARLTGHRLLFHKKGADGSGKCDAHCIDGDVCVFGVVFELHASDKQVLDRIEGLGYGYDQKTVSVIAGSGEWIDAVTYYANSIDADLQPFHWYKAHVLHGAREQGLPPDYIERIAAVESIPDPDAGRHHDEMAIYRSG